MNKHYENESNYDALNEAVSSDEPADKFALFSQQTF